MANKEQTYPPIVVDPDSPWAAVAEQQAAAAEHYAELSIASGMAFRGAQQEAYEGYAQQEAARSSSAGRRKPR